MNIADQIASAIGARKAGGWWRTSTAHCHGGDTAGGLAFRSPRDDPDRLSVHCYSQHCHETKEGRNRARDNLRAAAGLPSWQPAGPQSGPQRRSGSWKQRKDRETPSRPQNAATGAQGRTGGDTAAYAARMWAAAAVSTGRAAPDHPVSLWLADRGLWPAGDPLPEAVQWLPRSTAYFPSGWANSPAVGALVLAMPRLDAPLADPRKVHLVAIDAQGRKAQHWQGGRGDKRTYGADASAYGLLWRIRPDAGAIFELHICEGLADGLRILRYADEPALVAVCAGTGYGSLQPGWFASVTLWPDADEAGIEAAQGAAQKWANQGYSVAIKQLAAGHDPASAPLTGEAEHG